MRRENNDSLRCYHLLFEKSHALCFLSLHLLSFCPSDDLCGGSLRELNALGCKAVVHFAGLEVCNCRGGPGVIATLLGRTLRPGNGNTSQPQVLPHPDVGGSAESLSNMTC